MDRVFLDANVLFSAAYRPDAGLRALWQLENTLLLASRYAVEEARRNLAHESQRQALHQLVIAMEVVTEPVGLMAPPQTLETPLPAKDLPIIVAALGAGATHLLTGDAAHFGALYGERIQGMLVLRPTDCFRL